MIIEARWLLDAQRHDPRVAAVLNGLENEPAADVIAHHRAFIARRRAERTSEEYRELTAAGWDQFLAHPVDCTTSRSVTGLDAWSGIPRPPTAGTVSG